MPLCIPDAKNLCVVVSLPVLQAEYEREEIDWSYIQVSRHGLCSELCARSSNSSPMHASLAFGSVRLLDCMCPFTHVKFGVAKLTYWIAAAVC